MTPNDIEILIHCHVSPAAHPRIDAPAVKETLESFKRNELVYQDAAGVYHTTERGAAHINQLCSTPWPKQAWIDEHGRIIDA